MEESDNNYDYIFKVLLLGNSDVGKSSLILRFTENKWQENFTPTIGVDFKLSTLEINNKKIKMQVWDTAGQERFRTIISSYFKGSHGLLLIFDITKMESFKSLDTWLNEIEKHANDNVLKILIGNKIDLKDKREVTYEEAKAYSESKGLAYMETSAKTGDNVNEAFKELAKLMMSFNSDSKPNVPKKDLKKLDIKASKNIKVKKGCC